MDETTNGDSDGNRFGRQELDPPTSTNPRNESAAPAESARQRRADDGEIQDRVEELIEDVCAEPDSFNTELVRELMTAALKLIPDGRDTGELKLITAAVKELRYAFRVFGEYPDPHKVTIFGSARTPPEHPDYVAAVEFSRLMAEAGWMVITGAGDGIMKAGHEGPGAEKSFGVSIRLPFETSANTVIAGDSKLINFRYFFTRKLMFLSQAEAVVCFPGGYGTLDEVYETLCLVQTGKASIIPMVFLEGETARRGDSPGPGENVSYWHGWARFNREQLMDRGWISEEDFDLFHIARDPADAAAHVLGFYRRYHSSRYVRDRLIIRMNSRLRDDEVALLNEEFGVLVKRGKIEQGGAHAVERDHLDLPRLSFEHTRYKYGVVRRLIDRINEFEGAGSGSGSGLGSGLGSGEGSGLGSGGSGSGSGDGGGDGGGRGRGAR